MSKALELYLKYKCAYMSKDKDQDDQNGRSKKRSYEELNDLQSLPSKKIKPDAYQTMDDPLTDEITDDEEQQSMNGEDLSSYYALRSKSVYSFLPSFCPS